MATYTTRLLLDFNVLKIPNIMKFAWLPTIKNGCRKIHLKSWHFHFGRGKKETTTCIHSFRNQPSRRSSDVVVLCSSREVWVGSLSTLTTWPPRAAQGVLFLPDKNSQSPNWFEREKVLGFVSLLLLTGCMTLAGYFLPCQKRTAVPNMLGHLEWVSWANVLEYCTHTS